MVSLTVAFTLLAVTTSSLGSFAGPLVRHESRRALPPHWEQAHRAPADTVLPLRIGLAQSNLDRIEELLLDVSHPESSNYGNHWSAAKVAETFRPSSETVDAVRGWLEQEGIDGSKIRLSSSGGWMEVNVSVSEAEQLLKTDYHVYKHAKADMTHIACASGYHVPEHISKHIEIITPTIHFDVSPSGSRMLRRNAASSGKRPGQPGFGSSYPKIKGSLQHIIDELENCDEHITPACVRALYDYVYEPLVPEKNSVGIVEYTTQAYLGSDLDLFFKNFSASQVGQRPKLVSIDGGVVQTDQVGLDFNLESSLDLQYSMGMVGKKQPVTLFQVGDAVKSASFNNFLDALDGTFCSFEGGDDPTIDTVYPDPAPGGYKGKDCGTVKPASVISSSYSYNEGDLTAAYAARQCAEYGKLGLMGVTFLYSSGDWGVAGGSNNGNDAVCLFPNGTQSVDAKGFNPIFPASCPFVTGVGATEILPGKKITDPEAAVHGPVASGGGFSTYFAAPDYQKAAVHKFLTQHPPPYSSDIFNASGRGVPDISLNGANYVVAIDGEFNNVWGTSASSPVLAAMLSAVNDARLAVGKSTIGFINPVLYSAGFQGVFNDIVSGTNPGCGTNGFSAVEGWDPVTGLGTPNFPKLLAKWLSLP